MVREVFKIALPNFVVEVLSIEHEGCCQDMIELVITIRKRTTTSDVNIGLLGL